MQHLDELRLAALDLEPATPAELAHLAACAPCRAERDAHDALVQLAHGAGRRTDSPDAPDARLTDWSSLSARLRAEGLLRTTGEHALDRTADASPVIVRALHPAAVSSAVAADVDLANGAAAAEARPLPAARRPAMSPVLRIAAAIMLVIGGAVAGRVTSSGASLPNLAAISGTSATVAAAPASGEAFASVEEATRVLTTAQRDYERASLWLASNDTTIRSPDVYRARLAALDQMMTATRAALREAPQDPLLNHYYLAAYTAREATLQQLIAILPVDKTIEGF